MDRRTAEIYQRCAGEWISRRGVSADARRRLGALADELPRGARVADLGCGPGWHGSLLRRRGFDLVGLDLADAMLREARRRDRRLALVRGDLARLPFARASLDAVWARNCYMHLPLRQLPGAFAELARVLRPGGRALLSLANLDALEPSAAERARALMSRRGGEQEFRGRLFVARDRQGWLDLLEGAGLSELRVEPGHEPFWLWFSARRGAGLADSIAPRLSLLVCGLNPSPLSAERGVPFASPSNRFWAAALRSGLLERSHDPAAALRRGVGFTDLVKRVTPSAREITAREFALGAERLARVVRTWQPRALLFVGLEGVRRALDPGARAGVMRGGFAGRPAYLMPSSSGRNATSSLDELAAHLRRALRLTRARTSG